MRRQPAADYTYWVGVAEYDGVGAFVRGARCADVVTPPSRDHAERTGPVG
ncbi:hypothetical protein AB0J48_33955 [Nocardia salmonicida]